MKVRTILSEDQKEIVREKYKTGVLIAEICSEFDIARGTVRNIVAVIRDTQTDRRKIKYAERQVRTCLRCSKEFEIRTSQVKVVKGRYCSASCSSSVGGSIACHINRPKGEKHPLYKPIKTQKAKDPIKESARYAVHYYVKKGKIKKLPCEVCGEIKVEAHHKDYSKKLDVEWLCRKHHRQADYRDGTKQGDFGH